MRVTLAPNLQFLAEMAAACHQFAQSPSIAQDLPREGHGMTKVLVIHGAGMNMRGKVQTEIFGPMTLPE